MVVAAQAGGAVRASACVAQASAGASWGPAVRLGGSAAVLAGGGLAVGLLRRRRSREPSRIEHLEARRLDAGLKVHLLACGRRRVLVATSRERVCVLDRWAEPRVRRFPAVAGSGRGDAPGSDQEPA